MNNEIFHGEENIKREVEESNKKLEIVDRSDKKIELDDWIRVSSIDPLQLENAQKDKRLKELWDIIKSMNKHRNCEEYKKDGRVPALYCRFIIEFICEFLLIKEIRKKNLTLTKIKQQYRGIQKCKKIHDLFYYKDFQLEGLINFLRGKGVIGRKDDKTLRLFNLINMIQDDTNDGVHLKISINYEKIDKDFTSKCNKIIDDTNNLIEEFLLHCILKK
jgi:hypothetical protein